MMNILTFVAYVTLKITLKLSLVIWIMSGGCLALRVTDATNVKIFIITIQVW